MDCLLVVVITLELLTVWVGLLAFADYLKDRISWNNGMCKVSGRKWVQFDEVADRRGYRDGVGNFVWISWNVDKSRDFWWRY